MIVPATSGTKAICHLSYGDFSFFTTLPFIFLPSMKDIVCIVLIAGFHEVHKLLGAY